MRERQALAWLAVAALAAIGWLALPFITGLLLGAVMAFMFQPLYELLVERRGHPLITSLMIVTTSGIVVLGALGGFITLFVTRAAALAEAVREQLRAGGALSAKVDAVTGWLGHFGISPASLIARLQAGAGEIASSSANLAASVASGTFEGFLSFFFALLTMYLVLRYWPRMVTVLELVLPLHRGYTRELLAEFRRVGGMTILGTVLTGLAQGLLAAVGFWITGVPQALFFGIATAVASLVPAVGTLLIWVPAGVYLFATGHSGRGVVELAWGALIVVGLSDYVIRPRLVGDATMPTLLMFIALFGGLRVLGLSGLIIGPVLMSLAVAVLRLYLRDRKVVLSAK